MYTQYSIHYSINEILFNQFRFEKYNIKCCSGRYLISTKPHPFKLGTEDYLPFFLRARVCWPLLCLCLPFCIFERCLDSNPESCLSRQVPNPLSHSSPSDYQNYPLEISYNNIFCVPYILGMAALKLASMFTSCSGEHELCLEIER